MKVLEIDSGFACCLGHATEQIADALRIPVEKAINPLSRGGFARIVAQVRRALSGATLEAEAQAVRDALEALDVDWANLGERAREAVFTAARTAIGTAPVRAMPAVTQTFRIVGPRIMGEARTGSIRQFGLSIGTSLSQRDRLAERYVRESTVNFIRDQYGVRQDVLSQRARDAVSRGLELGLGRDAIAADLRTALGSEVMRGQSYWQLVAGQFVNSARTFSQITAFQEAGIERFVFSAVLDEVTTDECRFYDGQTFSLASAAAARDRLSSMTNPDDVYAASPWVRSGTDESGNRILYVDRNGARETIAQIDRSGVGTRDDRGSYSNALSGAALENATPPIPPLHANCRSTIEPAGTA